MTVTTTLDRQYFDGDGNNKVFPFNFRFFTNDQIYVSLIAPDGSVSLQVLTTNYTLAGALQAGGGTVTMLVAPPLTSPPTKVFIQRIVAEVQPTSIRNQGKFYPEIHEDVFDRLTMLIQQAIAGVKNSIQLTFSKSGWDFNGYKGINVGDGAGEKDSVNIRTMRSYVDSMVAGVVGGFGYFLQAGVGAVIRTFNSKMRDRVSIMDFGAIGGSVAVYHPLSERFSTLAAAQAQYPFVTSLTQSIDWAATQAAANTGKLVTAPDGKFVMTDPVDTSASLGVIGEGLDRYTPYAPALVRDTKGTYFIPYGDAFPQFSVRHISNADTSGGVLANPSAADPYTATAPVPIYSLYNFTNADAVGAAPATAKLFSAMFVARNCAGVQFKNFRVIPWNGTGGQDNYKSSTSAELGAKWDVGVWLHNTTECVVDKVQSVGYWRIASVLKTISADSDGALVQGETDRINRCTLQGFVGFMARSYDLHRVVAVGASTVSIPWSASHQFQSTGTVRIQAQDRAYTSLTFDGVNLVFNGIDTTGVNTSSELRIASSSFGSSGTVLDDCYINSLGHHSQLSATSNLLLESDLTKAWTIPSSAIEISGEPNRAYILPNCTVISNDDRMVHFHNSRDMDFSGSYFEAKSSRSVIGSDVGLIPAGARWIATRQSAALVPHPAGFTSNLRSRGHSDNSALDLRPTYDAYPASKYITGTGLFYPREVQIDKYNSPALAEGRMQIRSDIANAGFSSGKTVDLIHGDGFDVLVTSQDGTTAIVRTTAPTLTFRTIIRHNFGNTAGDIWYTADSAKFYGVGGGRELGLSTSLWAKSYVVARYYNASLFDGAGAGSPEGAVTAAIGSTFRRTNGAASTSFYVKESGAGNTGWVAK